MTDASDIYRRFVEAPLRLKTRTQSLSPPSTPPPSAQQYDASNPSPWGDSPAFSTRSKEVQKLRRRVSKIKLFAVDAAIRRNLDDKFKAVTTLNTGKGAGTSSEDSELRHNKAAEGNDPNTLSKKKKRVTRSMHMKNEDTGEDFMDTPTRASRPPKRFRKHSRDLSTKKQSGKENCNAACFSLDTAEMKKKDTTESKSDSSTPKRKTSVTIALPVRRSRRLQHVKAESPIVTAAPPSSHRVKEASDRANPAATSPTEESVADKQEMSDEKKSHDAVTEDSAAQMLADVISTYCDTLLATNTISGCFFALSWNALRDMRDLIFPKESNPLESVFTICHGIAECEKIAQHSFPSKSPKMKSPKSPKLKTEMPRRRSSGKILLKAKKKKSVHFQSFDLSCLNLKYVEDEQLAVMVDKILTHYGIIMEQLEEMVTQFDTESDSPVQAVLRELSRVMASPSKVYSYTYTSDAAKKTYRRAYGGRDLHSQHEIQISGEFFARQFANLLLRRTSPASPQFLQGVFSSLASSSVRFKLRVLFIESEDFGEGINAGELESHVLLDEEGKPFPAMAPYEHQELGAAIHWALQESALYWPLVLPLYNVLEREEGGSEQDSPLKTFLDDSAAEDLDHMEKYVLARRFLRFHLTKSWRHRLKDNDVAEIWTSIEKVCSLAKRFHFEDEAHLFPLAFVEEFVTVLAREEPTLQRMEKALQSFYEQKYGMSSLQPEPCMECHHLITREEMSLSIRCTSCARRFHLGCLHLPESFTQYAEHYTCPACFLGRGGY